MENLQKQLKKNIEKIGYTAYTPIQKEVIPQVIMGKDVLGQSYTGSGKTASFLIPLIEKIEKPNADLRLIIAPTRELAIQISQELAELSKEMKLRSVIVVGGENAMAQKKKLREGVSFIIGTPGRIIDLIKQKAIKAKLVKTVVLDEVDELLNMGFLEDLEVILEKLPKERQSLFFSATLNTKIEKLCKKNSKDLVLINTNQQKQVKNKNITEKYAVAKQGEKNDLLAKLLLLNQGEKSIIFVRTKKGADELKSYLQKEGFSVDTIHGDLTQQTRTKIYHNFKSGGLKILVATDVAARGIHIDNLEYVYNFDLPENKEYYTHRIGRTGRAGNVGTAISFVTPKEKRFFAQKFLDKKAKVEEVKKPSFNMIASSLVHGIVDKIEVAAKSKAQSEFNEILLANLYARFFDDQSIIEALVAHILKENKINK